MLDIQSFHLFQLVQIEYTGTRDVPARVIIYHERNVYNAQGYIFGGGRNIATMTKIEADILTGVISPVVNEETGEVVTGFVVDLDLGKTGLAGESWRLFEPVVPVQPEPIFKLVQLEPQIVIAQPEPPVEPTLEALGWAPVEPAQPEPPVDAAPVEKARSKR